jgi:hypothetical protein
LTHYRAGMATPQFVQRPLSASDVVPEPPQQQHRRNKSTDTANSSIGMNFNDNQSILTNQSWFGVGGGSVMIHPSDNQTVTSNATNLFLQFDSHQQLYYCPHHRYSSQGRDNEPPQPIYYKYATDSCPHCEQEFKNHTAYLQQRKKDVMEQLDMYSSVAGEAPNGNEASPRHTSTNDAPPPTTVTMMPNAMTSPPPPSQQLPPQSSIYAPPMHYGAPSQPYAPPPPAVMYHAPPPQAYHHPLPHHSAPPPPPPMQFASSQHLTSSSYSTPPSVAPPADDVARMRHIQDYIFLEKSKECDDMKQKLQQQTELIQQLKIENALLTEKLVQQEMRMQQELKFLKHTAAHAKKAAKSTAVPPQRSLVLVPDPSTRRNKNRLDPYHHHGRRRRPGPMPITTATAIPSSVPCPRRCRTRRHTMPTTPFRPHWRSPIRQGHRRRRIGSWSRVLWSTAIASSACPDP